jgi:hypothetical protein
MTNPEEPRPFDGPLSTPSRLDETIRTFVEIALIPLPVAGTKPSPCYSLGKLLSLTVTGEGDRNDLLTCARMGFGDGSSCLEDFRAGWQMGATF